MSHYGSRLVYECCFMLTFTLHRIITMRYNYTNHKALKLFILFYQTACERSKISECNLGSCCWTDVNAKPEPKVNTILKDVNMSSKEQTSFLENMGWKILSNIILLDSQTTRACRLYAYVLVHMHVCMRCSQPNECLHFLRVSEQNSDIRNYNAFICLFQLNSYSFDLFAIS